METSSGEIFGIIAAGIGGGIIGGLIVLIISMWRQAKVYKRLAALIEDTRPRYDIKVMGDKNVPEGRAYAMPLHTCPVCRLIDKDQVVLSGQFLCKSCYFKQTGRLWGVDQF